MKAVFIFIKVQYNKQNKKRKSTCKSKCLFWSYWPDSNRRPADYESLTMSFTNFHEVRKALI